MVQLKALGLFADLQHQQWKVALKFEHKLEISAATHNAACNFEKKVVRLVIRKRQDIEPVLNDMRLELLNIQRLQSEGRLELEKWDANELARLC